MLPMGIHDNRILLHYGLQSIYFARHYSVSCFCLHDHGEVAEYKVYALPTAIRGPSTQPIT